RQIVRLDGVVKVVSGSTLALGFFPRLSARALTGSMVPTTLAGHSFWKETHPAKRSIARIQFVTNLTMVGGLLIVAGDKSEARHARKAERQALCRLRADQASG